MQKDLLNTREASEYTGIPVKKLRNWRERSDTACGPDFVKHGSRYWYHRGELDTWCTYLALRRVTNLNVSYQRWKATMPANR